MHLPVSFRGARTAAVVLLPLALAAGGCRHKSATASDTGSPAPTEQFAQAPPPFSSPPVLKGNPDVATLVEKVKPSVVNITTSSRAPAHRDSGLDPFDFFFRNPFGGRNPHRGLTPQQMPVRPQSLGTGFIIDRSGYVVTNDHVIDGADDIQVKLADGRDFKARVVGTDGKLDVALIKIDGARDLPAAVFGDSDKLRVGEYVVAEGNPFGLGQTVTMGIVSAKDRSIGAGPYDDFIQTDASINPGNSGGPLFNLQGEVVGMNTAINPQGQGIGFAIPSNLIKDSVAQLRETGHVQRGKLGLVFQPVTNEIAHAMGKSTPEGALVAEVEPDGPAAKAGIRSGDLITAVDGQQVREGTELPRMVARHRPGSSVAITYTRSGTEHTARVTLGALPDQEQASAEGAPQSRNGQSSSDYGLVLRPAKRGVQVVDVTGPIQNLRPGDVILQVDGKDISSPSQVSGALGHDAKGKKPALMKIVRDGHTLFVAVEVGQP